MADNEQSLEWLDRILQKQLTWIGAADAKATLLFAIDSAMLAVLASVLPQPKGWSVFGGIVASLAAVTLVCSVACVVASNWPRLKGPRGSLVYFGGVSSMDEDQYVKKVKGGVKAELIDDFARQCHRNAEIAHSKYKWVQRGATAMCASLPAWLIAIWLLYSTRESQH